MRHLHSFVRRLTSFGRQGEEVHDLVAVAGVGRVAARRARAGAVQRVRLLGEALQLPLHERVEERHHPRVLTGRLLRVVVGQILRRNRINVSIYGMTKFDGIFKEKYLYELLFVMCRIGYSVSRFADTGTKLGHIDNLIVKDSRGK